MSACAIPASASTSPHPSTAKERTRQCDAALVRRCRDGDEAAWVAIVTGFSPYVYAIATRFGLRGDRAEDVFQEVFTRVFAKLGSLRDEAALKPWIAQLTRRAAIDRLRSDARQPLSLNVEKPAEDLPDITQIEQAMSLWHAVDDLPSPYRDVVCRFFLEDQSYDMIAESLGIPAGTIASRISRGLSMLRGVLEPDPPAASRVA